MKRLLILSAACLSLASCSKKATQCYTCINKTEKQPLINNRPEGGMFVTRDTVAECNVEDVFKYERENSKEWKTTDTAFNKIVTCK